MPFSVSDKALERLEWPALVERLARHARTPGGRAHLAGPPAALFEAELADVRARLAETSEARAILDAGDATPLGALPELRGTLPRLRRGGVLAPAELRDLAAVLAAAGEAAAFLRRRAELAPGLAALGEAIADLRPLARAIDDAIDPEGEVCDAASPALAAARAQTRGLAAEAQRRITRLVQDRDLAGALRDTYFTMRGDRYVLPVRAEARARVPGIVHDASASGTTVFIEPQPLVELNNRLKQAELEVERETRRVLAALSGEAARHVGDVEANLARLTELDLAFARGALSRELDAVAPVLDAGGVVALGALRHPLLPRDSVVPNDLRLGEGFHVLVVSGPNAGGKTVGMKSLALAALMARAGLHVPAAPGARLPAFERVLADIGDEQDIRESLSTFSAHMANLAAIVAAADPRSLVVLDEIGVGTDPGEGAALAQSVLEALADAGARVVATTHYNLLKEMAAVDARFENASVEFDPDTLAPTYRLRLGAAGSSSATAVAARMGMPARVVERAAALLEREDRRLDQMLSELSASRAALERERSEATRLRRESEEAREAYRARLERLHARRDELMASLRRDLERAFRDAHAEVAGVIRDLQRRGGDAREAAREAARAREKLLALERETERRAERERPALPPSERVHMDWRRAQAGDAVGLPGGRTGRLLSLPDRRGRVSVQVGSATLQLAADQVTPPPSAPAPRAAPRQEPRIRVDASEPAAPSRLDLRGLRVEEALGRVEDALDGAARAGRERVEIIHGIGTGALREAVRAHLRTSPYVARVEPGEPERGGEGVTTAHLLD